MIPRKCLAISAIVLAVVWACSNRSIMPGLRPIEPQGSGERLDAQWAIARLREASVSLREALADGGAEAHLSLRFRPSEVEQLYTEDAAARMRSAQVGTESRDGEPRWVHLRALRETPLVGFCARGARIAERNGPDGLRARAMVVDRLLIVGAERDGLWGTWIEGLVLTEAGWRMSAAVPFAQQVEDPRREHADVQLWDCDLGERPRRDRPLERLTRSEVP
jgi:hypothetical protein